MTDEAAKTYRHVLQRDPTAPGAHYGLAFLLIRAGQTREAIPHLRSFLANPPPGPSSADHVSHANATLAQLTGERDEDHTDPDPT
jgi:cytochrome c-type biogenesis protein CcmH/NrfG